MYLTAGQLNVKIFPCPGCFFPDAAGGDGHCWNWLMQCNATEIDVDYTGKLVIVIGLSGVQFRE